ncbi:hypothetical protein GQ54DRAFT_110904 [Martensiomyces pterosporus]|nr:hypothetical protein GQ54DRAFT_110904 [Martensiomyces pterosporus]
MYTVVDAARLVLGYALVLPLLLGALVATLLCLNVLASYWFQRRRESTTSLTHPSGPRAPRAPDPPVPKIARLVFAAELPKSSLYPTEFNREDWAEPRLSLRGYGGLERELGRVLGLVVRDFVQAWFRSISADSSFPRCVLSQAIQSVDGVVERAQTAVDPAEFVVGQVMPLVTAHLRVMRECEAEALGVSSPAEEKQLDPPGESRSSAAVREKVLQAYAKTKWHPALAKLRNADPLGDEDKEKETEKRLVMAHVRRVVDLLVPLILPPEQSSFAPHRVLVRELLNGALLTPVVQSLAEPDTINQLLDGQLERLIREQHMVNELRDALDKQAADSALLDDEDHGAPGDAHPMSKSWTNGELAGGAWGTGKDEDRQNRVMTYEQFMATIEECSDVEELGRIREDILAQIRKRRILIMGQNKDDIVHGQRVRDIIVYINRLYVAKKKAERRLDMLRQDQAMLGTGGGRKRGNSASSVISPFSSNSQQQEAPAAAASAEADGAQVLGRSAGEVHPRPAGSRGARHSASRASTYYEYRDDPTKLGPPRFTLHEILTNVSSLSAFAEYMDLIGHQLLLEFWVNVEGIRQSTPSTDLLPSIVSSLWKNYFTLRVDELASLGGEVDVAISRVQRCLKPHRVEGSLELDAGRLTGEVCAEAFELICLVQGCVFRHMELSEYPPFLRSTFYSRFLKSYYVTPRKEQISSTLFSPTMLAPLTEEEHSMEPADAPGSETDSSAPASAAQSAPGNESSGKSHGLPLTSRMRRRSGSDSAPRPPSLQSKDQKMPRRLSLVRSMTGSLGKRSVSGESSSSVGSGKDKQGGPRKWSFAMRGKPEAPIVGTDRSEALVLSKASGREHAGSSAPALRLIDAPAVALGSQDNGSGMPKSPQKPVAASSALHAAAVSLPRRSIRVGRSEVRRLSASLRSIALTDAASLDRAASMAPGANDQLHHSRQQTPTLGTSSDNQASIDDGVQMEAIDSLLAPAANSDSSQPAVETATDGESQEEGGSDDTGDSSADEAESLVIARVIKTPVPGDLFLDERLNQLSRGLERKSHQMAIVRVLMRQAQSRHKPHEQRVLRASYRGLRREVHASGEQQRQYESCLDDHQLSPTRTLVHIPRAISTSEGESGGSGGGSGDPADAKSHVVYLIELQQSMPREHQAVGQQGLYAPTGWVVARRYREFYAMHRELKSMWPAEMRSHELPARTPLIRLQRDRDIEQRRLGLEKYLQGLLREPAVCSARPLRLFLSSMPPPPPMSQSPSDGAETPVASGWMAQIYKTVGEDIEGITGADSMLEIIVQELGAQVAMQQTPASAQGEGELAEAAAFIDPLSDLFIEVFGLKNRRNWLRRQAISILLRHIVGGAVERRVRDIVGGVLRDELLAGLVANLRNTLWPTSKTVPGLVLHFQGFRRREREEKEESERRARRQILWYVPRVLAGMVGRRNAREGARRLIDVVQYRRPNLNLALGIFDAAVAAVFPEIKYQLDHP